jgi:hypothetical protein
VNRVATYYVLLLTCLASMAIFVVVRETYLLFVAAGSGLMAYELRPWREDP